MKFDRRELLKGGAALSAVLDLRGWRPRASTFAPTPGAWRTFPGRDPCRACRQRTRRAGMGAIAECE